jgi:hypothetical protein
MPQRRWSAWAVTLALLTFIAGFSANAKSKAATVVSERNTGALLWREPLDIGTRNLYYGIGGEKDQPRGPYTFVEEDLNGSNPKPKFLRVKP